MKSLRAFSALLFSLFIGIALSAQPPNPKGGAPKSPGDLAADEFFKVRNDKDAKLGQARFTQILTAGFAFLAKYPTHARANDVIRGLTMYGGDLREKSQLPYRAAWVAQLQYEILNQKYSDKLNDDGRAAIAALAAGAADFEVREVANRDNLTAFREKIDALAAMPNSARFLLPQERSYVEVLKVVSPPQAEAQVRKLIDHPDKGVAGMAREELNLIEVRKEPFAFKFTALDGKEFDVAPLRGKVVALVFWATTDDASMKDLEALKDIYSEHRKKGFEVVTVSYDKEEDREKVVKFVKEKRIPWPVYFDGKGAKNDFGSKLNVRRVPVVALFDQKGILGPTGLRANRVDAEVKKMLAVKDPAAPARK